MDQQPLLPHLFRTEYSKITAVLCKQFGVEHFEFAEDIASETFLSAVEIWSYNGPPPNPTAWLYSVAKNKARNYFLRNKVFLDKILPQLSVPEDQTTIPDIDLSEKNIADSQLRMLFAICHPRLSKAAQIGLALRILCGFGLDELANAFLTNKETIHKRLQRAKELLRKEKVQLQFPAEEEIGQRLETVQTTLYLLFSEGYYSERQTELIRKDLCLEAMRLTYLLLENEGTCQPDTYALLALMCYHSSRLEARTNANGEMILYEDQDRNLWNQELIERGHYFLQQAAQGRLPSKYFLEAQIAYWHTLKVDTDEKWEQILQLYNHLLQIEYSPVAALNRTFALSKARGKEVALQAAERLNLGQNHFYHLLLGELCVESDLARALRHFENAFELAKTAVEQQNIAQKIAALRSK